MSSRRSTRSSRPRSRTACEVILFPYRYPALGQRDLGPPADPATEFRALGPARPSSAQSTSSRAGTRPNRPGRRGSTACRPTASARTARGDGYCAWLWQRYAAAARPLTAFEVVNEPNLQVWPQRSPVDTDDLAAKWGIEGTHSCHPGRRRDDDHDRRDRASLHLGPLCWARPPRTATSTTSRAPRRSRIARQYAPTTDPFVESLLATSTARLHRRRPLDLVVPQLRRHRARSAPCRLSAAAADRPSTGAGRQLDGGPELWGHRGWVPARTPSTARRPAASASGSGAPLTRGRTARVSGDRILTEALSRHHRAKGDGIRRRPHDAVHDLRRPGVQQRRPRTGRRGWPAAGAGRLERDAGVRRGARCSGPPGARSPSPSGSIARPARAATGCRAWRRRG